MMEATSKDDCMQTLAFVYVLITCKNRENGDEGEFIWNDALLPHAFKDL